jgi:hypothetical protein
VKAFYFSAEFERMRKSPSAAEVTGAGEFEQADIFLFAITDVEKDHLLS